MDESHAYMCSDFTFLCLYYPFRESSRVVFIPFEPAQLSPHQIDDTELLDSCRDAGDAVPIFVKLGKLFEEADRAEVDQKVSEVLLKHDLEVNVRIKRTYTILLQFTLKVTIIIAN